MKALYPGIMLALAGTLFSLCASSQSGDQRKQGGSGANNAAGYTSASCPITKPSDSSFVPPAPYPAEAPSGGFFFGTPKLWALLWGDWQRATNGGNKTVWWSEGYNGKSDPQPKLLITGQRLGTHDPSVVVADHGNGARIEVRPYYFITAGVPLPGPRLLANHSAPLRGRAQVRGLAGPVIMVGESNPLVRRWFLDVIDDEDLDLPFAGHEFESELVLNGAENRRTDRVRS